MAVLTAVLLTVTACTGPPAEEPQADPSAGRLAPPSLAPRATLGPGEGTLNLLAPPGHVETGRTDRKVDWVTAFTRATGCKVSLTLTESPEETLKLFGTGAYDGVAATGDVALRLVGDGRVAPLNTALVPHYAGVVPGLRSPPWSSVGGRSYGVPHGRSATLLMWRTDKVKPAPTSWNAVYRLGSPYAGRIGVHDSPMTIADAAVYLKATAPEVGIEDPYALTPAQLAAAVSLLKMQRGMVGSYWRDYTQQLPAFAGGSTVIGSATQATVELLRAGKTPVAATLPAEGTTGTSTTWMLATKAKHPVCMYRWMDHILGPAVNARAAEWLGIAPATAAACRKTVDPRWCATTHATDEPYWAKVAIWRTPLSDCLRPGAPATGCTDYAAWRTAWRQVVT
ncbi:MAG TPA: extracellular solute-binding protein [Cryptosporangiaceae bacterium]|nr:extracellular solute-binding protein [Cryptosporangiaceae bacterium]